jgi:O-antigen chain-terminating methyltransferase
MDGSIEKLAATLPEIYQPIFGHPELSHRVSRACADRLVPIEETYRALEQQLGRPLRVLDLGCAQGFFSLSLAKLGAKVHGVDFLPGNIATCRALAEESPELEASFEVGRVEAALAALDRDRYDLVLGLSVFHHIVHQIGALAVQTLLAALANKVAVGIFEMALASEPPAWAASQPRNPRQLLAGFGFVLELGQMQTHLSTIARPLYFASSRYWRLNGQMRAFDRWTADPHIYSGGSNFGTRRYFFGGGLFVKLMMLDFAQTRAANLRDHWNEVAFLSNPPAAFAAPKLALHGCNEREAWLAREEWPGVLLSDLIGSGQPYDARAVLQDVAEQLAALEGAGLYHNDLRAWNVLVARDGRAKLIDYGAISKDPQDCAWPHNLFLSFLIFMQETLSGRIEEVLPLRAPKFDPESLPEPFRGVAWRLLQSPAGQWRFSRLRDDLAGAPNAREASAAKQSPGVGTALQAMEQACALYRMATIEWRNRAVEAEARLRQLQSPGDSQAAPHAAA